jgi:hypothetical protein
MKLVLCVTVLTAAAFPQYTPTTVERLHIKASFDGEWRGKGESESFIVVPDRLLQKSQVTQLRPAGGRSDTAFTAGFQDTIFERNYSSRVDGFVGSMPLPSGVPAPKWWTDELRQRSLAANRFEYTRWLLPIFSTASTITSTRAIAEGIVFQDRDGTTWTLKLDASGRPASLLIEGALTVPFTGSASPAVVAFNDYRAVAGGFTWPHKFVLMSEGKILETTWIKSYEINGKVPKVLTK